jgi:transcriptional regulator with XRE-family HTH domain
MRGVLSLVSDLYTQNKKAGENLSAIPMLRLRVREILRERGISQGRLSREANVPINLVRRLVNDKHYMPSSLTLWKVARYLKVPMEELLEEVEGPEEEAENGHQDQEE